MRPVPLLVVVAAGWIACVPHGADGPTVHDDTDAHSDAPDTLPADDTDPPEDTSRPGPPGLHLGPAVACSAAEPPARPFTPLDGGSAWAARAHAPTSGSLFVGGGLGVADFSGDGLPDLLLTADELGVSYWVQAPDGTLLDRTDALPPLPDDTTGVTAVDLDADGDLDAIVTSFRDGVVALRNDGRGGFDDATTAWGLPSDPTRRWMSSAWADVDGDGDLDGFLAAYGALSRDGVLPPGDPSMLLRNDGDTFVDLVAADAMGGALAAAHTFAGAFVDLDGDARPELYLVNDFGWRWPSLALWNEAGRLVQRDPSGFEQRRENMGLALGDVNADGAPDLVVAAWDEVGLFLSSPTGWYDAADARGMRLKVRQGQNVAWGPDLGDLDNDGDLDAALAIGFLDVASSNTNPEVQPDALWLQGEDGTFVDVAPAWGLDHPGRSRAVLLVDWNRDGALDLLRTDLRGPPQIWINTCSRGAWLRVALRQPGPNPFAIGARVTATAGGRSWTADVRAGGTSYGAGGPPEVHLGLGDVTTVDLRIRWPDGATEEHDGVPVRREVRAVRP